MKKCFIVYIDEVGSILIDEVDTTAKIEFTSGGFIEYETRTEFVQIAAKDVVKIYFE